MVLDVDSVLLDLGIVQIHYYSLTMFLGFFVGGILYFRECKKHKIDNEKSTDLLFWTVIVSIIGSRIWFVLFNLDYYLNNFLDIFKVWEGGLAIHGGIIASIVLIYFYTKKHKIPLVKMLDIMAVSLIIGQVIGRWGNFFNSEAHGGIVSLEFLQSIHLPKFIIDGMFIGGAYYHPTFLYEGFLNLLGFTCFILIRKYYKNLKVGMLSGMYLIWYGIVRFFVEAMRTDKLMLGSMSVAQSISVISLVTGICLLYHFSRSNKLYRDVSA